MAERVRTMNARWRTAARRPFRAAAWCGTALLCVGAATAIAGQGRQTTPPTGPGGTPGTPSQPGAPTTTTSTPPSPAAPTVVPRTFTGTAGLLFNTVRPERVTDFELLLSEVQQALAKS